MNYTKGEWEALVGYTLGIIRSPNKLIAEVVSDNFVADAHLIAAAPALHMELTAADATICTLCKRLNPWHRDCSMCEDRASRLQALAKAEGKEKK